MPLSKLPKGLEVSPQIGWLAYHDACLIMWVRGARVFILEQSLTMQMLDISSCVLEATVWENPLAPYLTRVVDAGRAYLQNAPSDTYFEEQKVPKRTDRNRRHSDEQTSFMHLLRMRF